MKVLVATTNGGLDDQVSPTFGRAPTFTLVDVEGDKIGNAEVVPNQFASAPGGAGIQAAQWAANSGAQAVIAGNYGPNASGVLNQAGVGMLTASGLTDREAVERHIRGELAPFSAGAMAAPGFGPGMGMGRGMGIGRGMGMGRGMGRGPLVPLAPPMVVERDVWADDALFVWTIRSSRSVFAPNTLCALLHSIRSVLGDGIGDRGVDDYCEGEGVPILLRIPMDRRIAELYSNGAPFVLEMPQWKERFHKMFAEIAELAMGERIRQ